MPEISRSTMPLANQWDAESSSESQTDKSKDNTTTKLMVSYGIRRTVRILPALITVASIASLYVSIIPSTVLDVWYGINESTTDAICLTASAVAVGSIANILSGVSSSFTHASLASAGIGVLTSVVFFLDANLSTTSSGSNYCHTDPDGRLYVCYGDDHFTSLVAAHGVFAAATIPPLFLTLEKAVSLTNKVATYIVDKVVKIREVSVANILNYLSPAINRKPATPFATDSLIEV